MRKQSKHAYEKSKLTLKKQVILDNNQSLVIYSTICALIEFKKLTLCMCFMHLVLFPCAVSSEFGNQIASQFNKIATKDFLMYCYSDLDSDAQLLLELVNFLV